MMASSVCFIFSALIAAIRNLKRLICVIVSMSTFIKKFFHKFRNVAVLLPLHISKISHLVYVNILVIYIHYVKDLNDSAKLPSFFFIWLNIIVY